MDLLKVSLCTLLSVVTMFIIAKVIGHKQVSQLEFFDYITGITIGSIAAELATELENPEKPLLALVIYGAVAYLLSIITDKFPRMRKVINGSPTIIMNGGKLYRENMKKAKIDLSEFMTLCREAGYFNPSDIETAVFETDGKLSILPKSIIRPLNPQDMNLSPKDEHIITELIMDGRILEGNLKRRGLDLTWLQKEIKRQKYNNAKEIFFAFCDSDNKLYIYPVKV